MNNFTDEVLYNSTTPTSYSTVLVVTSISSIRPTASPADQNDFGNAAIFCGIMIPCVLAGCIGHVMVLLSIFYHEELYRPLNVILANLTVAQFFMLLITVFGSCMVMLTYPRYTADIDQRDVLCFLTYLFSTANSVFYGLIAANRVMATIYETLYAKVDAWKVVWILSVFGWLLSLIAAIFPWMASSLVSFTWDTYFLFGHPWFETYPNNSTALCWVLMCAYFFIPAISVIMCYTAVFVRWSSSQQLAGVPINSQKAINLRDRARVLLMLAVSSGVYIFCFYTTYIYWSVGPRSKSADYFFMFLIYAQNALNPAIYGLIYPKFREAYFRVMMWILRKWSCRKSGLYGDSRRVFPTTGGLDMAGPPSVVFHSAKNSIIFHNTGFNNQPIMNENQFITVKQLPVNTGNGSARNLELKVSELSSSVANRSSYSQNPE